MAGVTLDVVPGLALPPVRAIALPPPTMVNFQVINTACYFFGWSYYTAGAATARYQFFNGADINGQMVGYAAASTLTSTSVWFGPQGIYCDSGLFMNAPNSVTTAGVIYVAY